MLEGNVYKTNRVLNLYTGFQESFTLFKIDEDEIVTCLEFIDTEDYGNVFYYKLLYKENFYYYRAINSVIYDVNKLIERDWTEIC